MQNHALKPICASVLLAGGLLSTAVFADTNAALAEHLDGYWSSEDATGKCNDLTAYPPGKMAYCMQAGNIVSRLEMLQAIADANNNNRAAGLSGYDASVNYIVDELMAMGYNVQLQDFDFNAFYELNDGELEASDPFEASYVYEVDFNYLSQTEPGAVSGLVEAVDLDLGLGNASSSGCETEDFDGFTPGNIALLQRGACSFQLKAENAANAGAIGAIIFNQGNAEGRFDLINATLGSGYSASIPVMFATYSLGELWAASEGLSLSMTVDVVRETRTVSNVLAETDYGDASNVVMLGSHLDSVFEGPGINDNGSGSAAILEMADLLKNARVKNKVRFAWWGAEEAGLVGSDIYAYGLSEEEVADIKVYLNFDMIASPNYHFGIYDGDGSSFGLEGPTGSGATEKLFADYFTLRGLAFEGSEISFRSDYAGFFDRGIPFGGLFTGAEGIKSEAQVAMYGGVAGEQFDPCYHSECDTIDNRSDRALEVNADAIAYVTAMLAISTSVIDAEIAAEAEAEAASVMTMRSFGFANESSYDYDRRGKYYFK